MILVIILALCVGFFLGTTTIASVLLYLANRNAFEKKSDEIDAVIDSWYENDITDRVALDSLIDILCE